MRKLFTLLLAVAAGVGTMFASDTQVDGIWYDFDSSTKTASVTYRGDSYDTYVDEYSGSVVIPSTMTYNSVTYSVTSIGAQTFRNCSGLTSVTIPNSVTSIGYLAFSDCSGLTSIVVENGNSVYDSRNNCNALIETATNTLIAGCQNTTIPNSVTSIGGGAFIGCGGLTSVTIPNSVTSIGDHAFAYCYDLTSVEIPNSVTSIGHYAFSFCSGLTSVTIGNGVTSIGYYAFYYCSSLSSVTIPNSVTSIGNGAFSDCSGLTSVTIPNSVTSIGSYAFAGCTGLKNVILGSSVKVLEEYAFYGCSAIESITCYSMRPPTVNTYALSELDYSTIVYVPADYLETYKMHDAWGLYDVRPLGAKSTETTDINVTPAETTAEVAWPAVSGAATYELVIKDKSGNVICTLVFNANGQLTQIAFNAPSRNNAPQQTQAAGFSFTITGLESGTTYSYTMKAKGNNGNVLKTESGTFTTTGESQGIEEVSSSLQGGDRGRLILHDGQIFILRGEKIYTVTGQEVK